MQRPRFHLALPVNDLEKAEWFYGEVLGCPVGRRSKRWIDFDLHGHQLVAQLVDADDPFWQRPRPTNLVSGHQVPAGHFGLILPDRSDWLASAQRFQSAKIDFLIAPHTRFTGEAGEQGTFFVYDPADNALEFKYFANPKEIFTPFKSEKPAQKSAG
jgi:uncharacterized protein